ncbi:Hsp70 family protein [Alteromonas sp. ASW11-19]|uniref:Hsp70 family protein n=1 Tax=Alteromonas salexigens TaxID=2982530 RepID=A0ABT2VRW6_9ALTE|nr:Hsp70 family protein [Alteromonas salexigens]MCU7556069.1 Hsp70 family protein [Alteromonas salexigens]
MAAIGIDYGTSNSEVAWFDGKQSQFISLDPLQATSNKIRSSVFIYYEDELPTPPASAVEAKVAQLKRAITEQIEKAKQGYYDAKDPREQQVYSQKVDDLRGEFHNLPALQRRAIQYLLKDMTVEDLPLQKLVETGTFAFGEEGFKRFLATPQKGRLIYSPKNFLGANLDSSQREAFVMMIARQLGYFRQAAESQLNQTVDTAVIGRPVRFHGNRGEEGNQQAVQIMTKAATQAGFTRVEFLEEPIAAAYQVERALPQPTDVLVVDIGGGTTDICCITLSPENLLSLQRQGDVQSVTGARLGGMECDKNLIVKAIAPTMGQGKKTQASLPVPPTYFTDMCAVDDIPRMNRFFSDEYGLDIAQTMSLVAEPAALERLLTVQTDKLSARLVNSSRMAKEMLSSKDSVTLPLNYIEPEFDVTISRTDLNTSMKPWLSKVKKLIADCLENSARPPQMLFMTGGMSLSPIVQQEIRAMLPADLPLIEGDAFNSVCEGLAIQASRLTPAK